MQSKQGCQSLSFCFLVNSNEGNALHANSANINSLYINSIYIYL